MTSRPQRSYDGELMAAGKSNEDIVLSWLQSRQQNKEIIDFREFRLAQRIDVDFGIESINGDIVLLEIKSDKWISETGNLCFECNRINHYATGKWFYLGWGWRSPAQRLLVRNPGNGDAFVFDFQILRADIGRWVAEQGRRVRQLIIETDDQKTTFNFLVPMSVLNYKKVVID